MIPANHVDIHSHLLPGIDDGAKTMEDTFSLVNDLQQMGIEQFITTPHIMKNVWENTREGIEIKLATSIKNLEDGGQSVRMRAAAEYLIDATFIKLFQNAPLLTLKENYVLVEMSYLNPPIQLYDIIFELQVAGYRPVLAHPERYSFYHFKLHEYERLKNAGCLFQLDLLSTVGYYGINVAKVSEELLKKGLINFVGTDVHHQNHINAFSRRMLFSPLPQFTEAIRNNQLFRI